MRKIAIITMMYGTILIVGGTIGYVKAHSVASLALGVFLGLLAKASGIAILNGRTEAQYLALGIASLLTVFFTYRFAEAQKFMPSGFMALLSCCVAYILYPRSSHKKEY